MQSVIKVGCSTVFNFFLLFHRETCVLFVCYFQINKNIQGKKEKVEGEEGEDDKVEGEDDDDDEVGDEGDDDEELQALLGFSGFNSTKVRWYEVL